MTAAMTSGPAVARLGLTALVIGLVAACLTGCGTVTSRDISTGCALARTGTTLAKDVTRGGANTTATTVNQTIGDACAGLAGAAQ